MQTRNKFDKETLVKIGKGALIAATGAAGLFILDAMKTIQVDNTFFASFMAWFIPTAVNAIKEWRKGELEEVVRLSDD